MWAVAPFPLVVSLCVWLTEAELKVLGKVGDIFLAKKVQVETHSKKGDILEPRLLVSI